MVVKNDIVSEKSLLLTFLYHFYTKNPVAISCIYEVMGAKKKNKNSGQTYALWEPVTLTVFIVWG